MKRDPPSSPPGPGRARRGALPFPPAGGRRGPRPAAGAAALLLALLLIGAAARLAAREITILSYNVENLFDDVDNGTEYPDYRPERGGWSRELFQRKVARIAEAIRKSVPGGPDVVALQEVENLHALQVLRDQGLRGQGYREAVLIGPSEGASTTPPSHTDAASAMRVIGAGGSARTTHPARPDRPSAGASSGAEDSGAEDGAGGSYASAAGAARRAGIAGGGEATHPAVLSRFPVRRTGYHQVGAPDGEPLRGVLEVELEVEGRPLYLFNNHWKSRSGGAARTGPARRAAARVLGRRLQAVLERDPRADILVLGDLNESVEELEDGGGLLLTGLPERAGLQGQTPVLYEPWYELPYDARGSYVYRGKWQTLDHILLSAGLFDRQGLAYQRGGFRAVREPFLLDPRSGFPKRWSPSPRRKGYSDHLPLCIRLVAADTPDDEERE